MVDIGSVVAESDDRGKSKPLGARFFQEIINLPFDLPFGLAGKQTGFDKSQSLVEKLTAFLNRIELAPNP